MYAVGYVKRVVIGNNDPETVNEEDIEKRRQPRIVVCQILRADDHRTGEEFLFAEYR